MKSLASFILLIAAMSSCRAVTNNSDMSMLKTYRVYIPNFVVDFLIPPELKQGYGGGLKTKVSFENPPNPRFTSSLGNGMYSKEVGTLFLGVKGDFSDWDISINLFVIKCDPIRHPMRSPKDLAEFAREFLSKKYVLANGKRVDDLGSLTIEKIGSFDVVVATRADPNQVRTVKIKNAQGEYTDAELPQKPYQLYYIRLDNEIAIGIRVSYDNERTLNPKWYAASHARITQIIENMKVEPKKGGTQ